MNTTTKHVVMFSGGIGSWAAAKRVALEHGPTDLTLLFTDTLIEDSDLYRFLEEGAANVGGNLVRIAEGRTPWQVYHDRRFLGNSRRDPCSKTLKRDVANNWLRTNCQPSETIIYVGIDWTEEHRFIRLRDIRAKSGWTYMAPMCDAPFILKSDMLVALKAEGIAPPRLYSEGFSHNNCGGFCCKAGQGQFANLLRVNPALYAQHESKEEAIRNYLGKNVSMMTDRRGNGKKKPLTMKSLRLRIEAGEQIDMYDIGGCGCFAS
jgi:3'-phosphoadenosine 5'-phosphosulfate sulfotransferase (PAPS reductase)/FAD synthetase